MKTGFLCCLVVVGCCLWAACNQTTEEIGATKEVTAVYQGLQRHPCSGHFFRELDGDNVFFAQSDWESGDYSSGAILHLTYELLPVEQLSCTILPTPANFRYIRILSAEE